MVTVKDNETTIAVIKTGSVVSEHIVSDEKIARLQEEVEDLTERLEAVIVLEKFKALMSVECNYRRIKITILECSTYRRRGSCISKRCLPRQGLLAKISL